MLKGFLKLDKEQLIDLINNKKCKKANSMLFYYNPIIIIIQF